MDVFDLSAEMPMDYVKPTSDYEAGFAHGAVASGILILFIWMSVWRCIQSPKARTIAGRLEAAERDL